MDSIKQASKDAFMDKWWDTIKKLEVSDNMKTILAVMYMWAFQDGAEWVIKDYNEQCKSE